MNRWGFASVVPNSTPLVVWDAGFYQSIMKDGYSYTKGQAGNSGFFPFFSYFWKYSGLNALFVCIANRLIFLVSLAFLCKEIKPNKIVLGLFMASPSMFFTFHIQKPFSLHLLQ